MAYKLVPSAKAINTNVFCATKVTGQCKRKRENREDSRAVKDLSMGIRRNSELKHTQIQTAHSNRKSVREEIEISKNKILKIHKSALIKN